MASEREMKPLDAPGHRGLREVDPSDAPPGSKVEVSRGAPREPLSFGARAARQTIPELITIPAAAHMAGIGVRQLRNATAAGQIPVFGIGRWPRVRWRDVVRWIDDQRVPATSHAERRVAEVLARESRKGVK